MATIRVADDLFINYDDIRVTITGGAYAVHVYKAELPDLIAHLIEAAEGMGISTVQGKLVKALKAVEWKGPDGECPSCGHIEFLGHRSDCQLQQALAKVEQ